MSTAGTLSAERLALFARLLDEEEDRAPAEARIAPRAAGAGAPLSFSQRRLWFLEQMEPGRPTYNIPLVLRLAGALDGRALERALGEVVRRHEALRTVFREEEDGEPVQEPLPAAGVPLARGDLSSLPSPEREAEVRRRAGEHARAPFDLAAGPLLRAVLLRLGGNEHVLLLSVHHIACDGWSLGIVLGELGALYGAFARGEPSPLAEPALQYADFAVWQRRELQGAALDDELAYWRTRLAGAPALLELPADRPRPPVQSHRGGGAPVRFAPGAAEGVRALARAAGATPFMVLLAAFQALLARWSGQDDLVVGTPVAGRPRAELEEVVGFFANTLAVRTDLSGDPSFRALLARVREAALDAFAHQQVPFERVVEALEVPRDLDRNPVFQAMFAYQGAQSAAPPFGDLAAAVDEAPSGTAKFDLMLALAEVDGVLDGGLEYAADLFDPGTAERMARHLAVLVEAAVTAPELRLSALPLLDPAERALVVDAWNDTGTPAAECVTGLFAAQAARTPDAAAVVHAGGAMSYRELDARANRLARRLRRLGAGPEVRVGVCLARGPHLPVAVLAVLKAGAAYLPLDPVHPVERLRWMLGDAGAPLVVTEAALRERVADAGARVLCVDEAEDEIARERPDAPAAGALPDNLAYILYTSGSTGRPKGVAMPHAPLAVLLRWQLAAWAGRPPARTLQFASLGFDVSFMELFATWCAGGTVVLVGEEERADPARLLDRVEAGGVERLFAPCVVLQHLAEAADERGGAPACLRDVVTAGEPLRMTPALVRFFAGGRTLDNQYGPTEAHVVSAHRLDGPSGSWPAAPPIGRPITGARLYVLDGAMRPAPVGVPGELYIGGTAPARGYLGRPALTAERFVPSPFAPGGRLYRTGDRARWRPDGTLECLGRLDRQVKVRGVRVEPGEVEAALLRLSGVRGAAVVARGDPGGGARLVGYVAADAGLAPREVREALRRHLPEAFVPAEIVRLDALPLTPHGKVDRRALPDPEPRAAAPDAAPRTPAEAVVAAIWAEVLGRERVATHDDFFELGGHSLLATRMMSRVRRALGADLPLRALFERRTVAGVAAEAERARGLGTAGPLPPLAPAPRGGALPLSFAQQRLWFLEQMQPGAPTYNLPLSLRFSGALDRAALEAALAGVAGRHEALRTVFVEHGGTPAQVILPPGPVALPLEDLTALPPEGREAELRRRAVEEARTPFDLARGPLFRARLLRLGGQEHVLLLSLHHIVSDGWSLNLLFAELGARYAAAVGAAVPLPQEPALQYADFAAWQRRALGGEALERELAFWRGRLAGAPALLELPTDRPRPPVRSYRGDTAQAELDPALAEGVRALARREGATPFMVLLAAFGLLLARCAGQDDVVVGTPVSGRTQPELEGVMGFFVNTLPIRADLSGEPTFRALLARVREAVLDAWAHQEVPFERVVDELRVERDLSRSPVFQAMFVYQEAPDGPVEFPGLRVVPDGQGSGTAKFDLLLGMGETEDGALGAVLEYATDLFAAATAERMLGQLRVLLEAAVADPERPAWRLPLTTPAERGRLLAAAGFAGDADRGAYLHERFAQRAARAPDAVAVTAGGERATYGELDARGRHVAARLRREGVRPGAAVAVCLERGPGLVAALLGVMRAGGAYLVLDPGDAPARLADAMRAGGVVLALTTAALRARFPGDARVLCLDEAAEPGQAEAAGLPPPHPAAACILLTAGRGAAPRGCAVPHGALVGRVEAAARAVGAGPGDAWTLLHPLPSVRAAWELWGALLTGGRVVMVPPAVARTPDSLRALLAWERVTVLTRAPSAFLRLAHADARAAADGEPLALRSVVLTGEAPDPAALGPWLQAQGGLRPRVFDLYALAEAGGPVALRALDGQGDAAAPGGPLPGVRLYVLDRHGEPCPPGVVGEVHVGGEGIAAGYARGGRAAAERFVPDPLAGADGARRVCTGDLALRRGAEAVELVGRADEQERVRGFRVDRRRVAAAVAALPGVREAAVAVHRDRGGRARLAAWWAGDGDAPAQPALRASLPEPLVPTVFVRLDALPLDRDGRVDLRALPAPRETRRAEPGAPAAPRTPREEALLAVWREVLGDEALGVDDNFFERGGDSLASVRLVARAREAGVPCTVQQLFFHQTVAALAAAAAAAPAGAAAGRAAPFALLSPEDRALVPAGVEDAWPATRLQLGMLYHGELARGSAPYHNVTSTILRLPFDATAIDAALQRLAARHPMLRTGFDLQRFGEPLQLVHAGARIPVSVTDLRGLPAPEREAALDSWFDEELARRFDVSQAPLMRFHLHRLTDDAFHLGRTEHHAILDGWTASTFGTELLEEYLAAVEGRALAEPPALRAGFQDYVRLERQALASDADRRFWAGRMEGSDPTRLPRRAAPAPDAAYRRRVHELPVPQALSDRLHAAAGRLRVPVKSVLLAAHLRVLGAMSGRDDVVTGVVSHGRPEAPDAERVYGLFLNTLPFRLRLAPGSWASLVRAVFEAERETLPFRWFPAAEIQRLRGGEALFETTFNFIHFHVYDRLDAEVRDAVSVRRWQIELNTDLHVDFGLDLDTRAVRIWLQYNGAAFGRGEVRRLARHYLRVLEALAADPEAPHERCTLLSPAERRLVTERWSRGAEAGPAECVHPPVAAQAARTPGAAAILHGGRATSYAELDAAANRLARWLRRQGVGPDTPVGVCLERGPELPGVLLAVLRAGGACLPLDPAYPAERLAYMLADARAPLVLTRSGLVPRLETGAARVVCLDAVRDAVAAESAAAVESGVLPANLAYVIYTSGSTGRPKGVAMPHAALANLLRWQLGAWGAEAAARTLQLTSPSFDVSFQEIFSTWCAGGALVPVDEAGRADPERLLAAISAERVERLFLPFVLLQHLADAAEADGGLPAPLREVVTAGEQLRAGPGLARLFAAHGGCRLRNQYGPTEAHVVSEHVLDADPARWPLLPPIGRPVAGASLFVLDARLRPVPPGVPGELCIGGAGVARGYLQRPALTAARFLPDPFSPVRGARMYRTGDRARWAAGGRLEYLGRLDQQVKVRGFRVEPGEVEAVLQEHPAVRASAVVAQPDAAGGTRLVGYAAADPAPDPRELRGWLEARLPGWLVPAALVVLPRLPLTPSGKVDRAALPPAGPPADGTPYVAPRTPDEAVLAREWAAALGVERVGVHDDFFALGGHSLLALRLAARMRAALGRPVPLALLVEHPTVAALAAALRGGAHAAPRPLVLLQPAGARPPFFCVHAVGGTVTELAPLARLLAPDRPVYGLQARGLEGEAEPLRGVPALAAAYVQAMRAAQPAGPYHLGGWSFGGMVAYEMGRLLQAAGERVAVVALLDTPVPDDGALDCDDATALAAFAGELGVEADDPAALVADLAGRDPEGRWRRVAELLRARPGLAPLDAGGVRRRFGVYRANLAAAAAWRPAATDLPVALLRARAGAAGTERWRALTPRLAEARVPGDHHSMLRAPHATALAAALASALERTGAFTLLDAEP